MRTETRYVFEVVFRNPHDVHFALTALEGAAREWASCSNESEPLLHLRDQLLAQVTEGSDD